MPPEDLRVFWTKHAIVEALEDGFRTEEIEKALKSIVEISSESQKTRGVVKLGNRYATVIFMKMKAGIRIITCWASSTSDINEYEKLSK
jgi:hypothetical protein